MIANGAQARGNAMANIREASLLRRTSARPPQDGLRGLAQTYEKAYAPQWRRKG